MINIGIHLAILVFSVGIFFAYHNAYADTEADSSFPVANPTYANTNLTATAQVVCTNYGGDADGDGICDNWENQTRLGPMGFHGLWINFTYAGMRYEYKLPCDQTATYRTNYTGLGVCPTPRHKDVYVELDWMKHHNVDPTAVNDTIVAFRNAPVQNLDGAQGIKLHVQYGELPNDGNTTVHYNSIKYYKANLNGVYVGLAPFKQNYFGTVAERTKTNPTHSTWCAYSNGTSENSYQCLTAKRFAFHYALFANYLYGGSTTSGWSEQVGNDMIISLGSFTNGKGSTDEQESTFMHELGHNLGLTHGGTQPVTGIQDDVACKPNYFSIMSPVFEYRGTLDSCRPLDFSRTSLSTLDEKAISSNNGIQAYTYPLVDPDPPGSAPGTCNNAAHNGQERPFFYTINGSGSSPQIYTGTANSPTVDWKQVYTTTNYSQNLNYFGFLGCQGSQFATLTGSDDWNNLKLVFVNSTANFNLNTNVPAPPPDEPPITGDEGYGDFVGIGDELTSNEANAMVLHMPVKSLNPTVGPDYPTLVGIAVGGTIGGGIIGWVVRGTRSK